MRHPCRATALATALIVLCIAPVAIANDASALDDAAVRQIMTMATAGLSESL